MALHPFANDLKCMGLDQQITKGPAPRWHKKCLEVSNSSLSTSLNLSRNKLSTSSNNSSFSRTPSKPKASGENTAPGGLLQIPKKTPSKTPNKGQNGSATTPGKTAKTPQGGDRFIPVRTACSFDLGNFLVNLPTTDGDSTSPSKLENQRIMAENLQGGDLNNMRILVYNNKAPSAPDDYKNRLKVVYSSAAKSPNPLKSSSRHIPHGPDRILDAPDIMDDYYLNLIDWSESNMLAVALSNCVYLWNAVTGSIEQLLMLAESEYVGSVSWALEGNYLAVGTSTGTIELWDASPGVNKRLRVIDGHSARIGSLSWNKHVLTSGSRSGLILHHDVTQRSHIVGTLNGHTQEVCGLRWSPDGRFLASGGNDNLLLIWAALPGQQVTESQPLFTFSTHQAAVKALAWCPWQPYILASGGGTADRHIHFWNCNTGVCINSVDTKSQVCGLLWSTTFKEFISGHGFAHNQLIIWKYPALTKVAELTGHTSRVLHLAMSPDGVTVLSAGADETLRLWKCFAPDPAKKKDAKDTKVVVSLLKRGIR